MAGVVEDMVRQSQCLDKINYKVLLIWDSECNCDVGWVTVSKTCGGRELKEKWRDSKYEVRDWNLDTEPDIVSNSVDMRDVRDVIDMNMERQCQYVDKTNYKVLLIWDSECNCDVGWITVRKNCVGRELEEKWRESKYDVRDWNLETEPDIVSNNVDMKDVSDVIDMNIEKEEIVIGDKDKNKNVNKGNIVRDENSISANMELKVKIGHKSQESSAGGESLGGSGRPRREGWSFSPPSYHSRISPSGVYSATTPQPLYPYHTQLTAPQPSKVGLGFVSHSYGLN